MSARAPRAWQRMLSGRRLDLLDPSPLDVEIEDIAHGLARVARWNGQTHRRAHLLRRAALAPGRGDRRASGAGPAAARAPDAPAARRAGIRHRRHHLALQGGDRRRLQGGGGAAPRAPSTCASACPPSPRSALKRLLKRADRIAAFHEATRLAGFAREEALKFFGRPDPLPAALEALPRALVDRHAQARYLERFHALTEETRVARGRREDSNPSACMLSSI